MYLCRDLKRPGTDVGKYGDVALLFSTAVKGPLYWVNKKVMLYRLHGANDGLTENFADRLRLLGYMKVNNTLFSRFDILTYRYFVYRKVSTTLGGELPKRAQQYVRLYPIIRIISTVFWINFFNRQIRKLKAL